MASFGQVPLLVDEADFACERDGRHDRASHVLVERALAFAKAEGIIAEGDEKKPVVCVVGKAGIDADEGPLLRVWS